jgi:anti-sigma B factor antagonist
MKINTKREREIDIISLDGDFISEEDQMAVQDKVRSIVSGKTRQLVFDLSRVRYINSCGLGSLVCALTTVRNCGGDIRLAGIGTDVDRVLKMTKLDTIFHIYPNIASALSQSNRTT